MASYGFVQTLKPEDYVAIIAYDLRSEILCDFTTDRGKSSRSDATFAHSGILGGEPLRRPGGYRAAHEQHRRPQSDSADRFRTGYLQQADLRQSPKSRARERACLFTPSACCKPCGSWPSSTWAQIQQLDFLQADNEMKTFARESGGQAFFPRFFGEFPNIFQSVSAALRNQYSLTYVPSNQAKDGQFRKIKVELVDPQTGDALRITEGGKPVKYRWLRKPGTRRRARWNKFLRAGSRDDCAISATQFVHLKSSSRSFDFPS